MSDVLKPIADFDADESVDFPAYFASRAVDGPELPLRSRPCADCAVTCGFYAEFTEALANEPPEIQLSVSKRWFCHSCGLACRGNADALGLEW